MSHVRAFQTQGARGHWATALRRGCPSRTAARRGPRSRGAVPSIGLAAGARIVQAPGLPPAPAPGACRAALGHGPQFVAAAPSRAGAQRFNRARAHIPGTEHASRGGRPRAPHAAEPPAALHLHGHFGKLPRARISLLSTLSSPTNRSQPLQLTATAGPCWGLGTWPRRFPTVAAVREISFSREKIVTTIFARQREDCRQGAQCAAGQSSSRTRRRVAWSAMACSCTVRPRTLLQQRPPPRPVASSARLQRASWRASQRRAGHSRPTT